jgi:hypothetical protein
MYFGGNFWGNSKAQNPESCAVSGFSKDCSMEA